MAALTPPAKLAPEPSTVARLVVVVASDRSASDILLLDVRGIVSYADYLVIMSAASRRQMAALAEEVTGSLKKERVKIHHQEGTADSGWVLLDYADVVVHIFAEEERDLYKLEQVWHEAKQVVRIQ